MSLRSVPRVSVMLATYRQPEVLAGTLEDLARQDYPADSWELIVVDDGSNDKSSLTVLSGFSARVSLTIQRRISGGKYAHASLFNELLRLANPSSSVFIHVEDVRLKKNFISRHARWHKGKKLFLVSGSMCEGPKINFNPAADRRWPLMQMAGQGSEAFACCFQAIFAKSMSYTRVLTDKLKVDGETDVFDSQMSGWGYHEVEFAYRATLVGATCVYDTGCAVYHPPHRYKNEIQRREINREAAIREGQERNVSYLCKKHGLPRLPDWQVGKPIRCPGAR